jgi:uncharacterized protein
MRILIDTNVLVSAVIRGREPKAVIEFIVGNPEFAWIVAFLILSKKLGK